jgi:hypothetical protein
MLLLCARGYWLGRRTVFLLLRLLWGKTRSCFRGVVRLSTCTSRITRDRTTTRWLCGDGDRGPCVFAVPRSLCTTVQMLSAGGTMHLLTGSAGLVG